MGGGSGTANGPASEGGDALYAAVPARLLASLVPECGHSLAAALAVAIANRWAGGKAQTASTPRSSVALTLYGLLRGGWLDAGWSLAR